MKNTNAIFMTGFAVLFTIQVSLFGKEKARESSQASSTINFFWCAKTDDNTHIGYCFEKQKECKEWSRKKFEQNGKKLHLCRPTKL